jgi:hypothetical protein
VQARPTYILHDEDDILGGVYDLIKTNDILMLHLLHEFDLPFHGFSTIRIKQLILFVDFHSNLFVCGFVETYSHNSIGSLSYLLSYYVVIQRALIREYHRVIIWIGRILLLLCCIFLSCLWMWDWFGNLRYF